MSRKILAMLLIFLPFSFALPLGNDLSVNIIRVLIPILFVIWFFEKILKKLSSRKLFLSASETSSHKKNYPVSRTSATQTNSIEQSIIPDDILSWTFLSFLIINILSLLWAGNPEWGAKKILFLLSIAPIYFISRDIFNSPEIENLKRKFQNKSEIKNSDTDLGLQDSNLFKNSYFGCKNSAHGSWLATHGFALLAFLASLIALLQFSLQFIIRLDPALNLWRAIMPFFLGGSVAGMVLEYPSWLVNVGGVTLFRAIGFFPDPHSLAFFLELLIFWPIFALLNKERIGWYPLHGRGLGGGFPPEKNKKTMGIFLFFVLCSLLLALLLTFSRGAYVGAGTSLVIFFIWLLFNKRNLDTITRKIIKRSLVAIGTVSIIAIFSFGNIFVDRLSSSLDMREGSNEGRLDMWREGWRVFTEHPLTGVGLGNFPLEVKPSADYREPIYAHNLYLDIAAETGIFGLLFFVAMILLAMRNFVRLAKDNPMYLAGFFSLLAFSVHGMFDNPIFSVHVFTLLCVILGIASTKK